MENKQNGQRSTLIIINLLLILVGTYASTNLTLSFFGTIGTGATRQSNILMALVNDITKVIFPMCLGYCIFMRKWGNAVIIILVTLGTVILSYNASIALDLNTENKNLASGAGKQALIDTKDSYKKSYDKMVSKKNKRITPLQTQLNEQPATFIKVRAGIQKNIDKIVAEYKQPLEDLQTNINDYQTKIDNYKGDNNLTTTGYTALSKYMGMSVGDIVKYKNIFMEILLIALSINLGMLLGETGMDLSSIWRKLKNKSKEMKEDIQEKVKPEIVDTQSNSENPLPRLEKEKHLNEIIKFLFETKTLNTVKGYNNELTKQKLKHIKLEDRRTYWTNLNHLSILIREGGKGSKTKWNNKLSLNDALKLIK